MSVDIVTEAETQPSNEIGNRYITSYTKDKGQTIINDIKQMRSCQSEFHKLSAIIKRAFHYRPSDEVKEVVLQKGRTLVVCHF